MGSFTKWLFAGLGWAVGGPIGALLGYLLGKAVSPDKQIGGGAGFRAYDGGNNSNAGNTSNSSNKRNQPIARHKCAICGKTDITNPEMTFRFCSKCNGNYEYCENHLYTHMHKQ